jgi:hypothetical protein
MFYMVKNEQEASKYSPDDTGKNIRDNNSNRKTADDQNIFGDETEVLARIRREILQNENLSMNGQNVKIIVENGKVLLRGPVSSLHERKWIGETAAKVASKLKIVNELEIAPS